MKRELYLMIMTGLILIAIGVAFIGGFIIGYEKGMKDLTNYAMQFAGKVQVDKVDVNFNETIITDSIKRLEDILFQKINETTLTQ